MDGKQLKNSILQWAIQGKLVPQNPKDEPASKLLERIAASRNGATACHPERNAVKSKDLKKKKSTPTSRIYRENGVWYEQVGNAEPKDISDDIPFEIPENWAWTRMGNIGSWGAGATPAKGNPAFYKDGVIPWLVTGELNNSVVTETKTKVSKIALEKCSLRLCKPGDVLIAMYGATIGKLAIAGIELTTNQACCACSPHYDYNKYLFYFLMASKSDLIKRGEGGAQPNISKEKLVNYLMPFPPLAEQKRIVAKLEQVLPLADEYGVAQEQLDKLNKELPETLKKSILQQAIQGKLVPQNPKDEPAQKLLERITAARGENSQPKGAKSKKFSPTSRIYCENGTWYEQIGNAAPKDISEDIPFEIPENWTWCRVKDLSTLVTKGTTPRGGNVAYLEKGIGFLRAENVAGFDCLDMSNLKYVDEETHNVFLQRSILQANDILITIAGTLGRTALVKRENLPLNANQAVALIRPIVTDDINLMYLIYALNCPLIQNELLVQKKITAIPNLTLEIISDCLIPLPPLAEQKRIVTKLEQLVKVL